MTDKEYKEQIKRLEKLIIKWTKILGIDYYDIQLKYNRTPDENYPDSLAWTSSNWEYRNGHLSFNINQIKIHDDKYVEYCVVHEMVHILLGALWYQFDSPNKQLQEINELVTTNISKAIIRSNKGN